MKKIKCLSIAVLLFVISSSFLTSDPMFSVTNKSYAARQNPAEISTTRERIDFVKEVNFNLKDGTLVYGKLISRDKSKVVLEQLLGSKIEVKQYSISLIDIRTLRYQSQPESKYYIGLAEYFNARTGDFEDDPDDFIQAVRWYEKAKRLIADEMDPDKTKIKNIDNRIKEIQADRKVWTKQVESRAKLKTMEFEATMETRVRQLESTVKNNKKTIQSMPNLNEKLSSFENSNKDIMNNIERNIQDLSVKYTLMEGRVASNERVLDRLGYNFRGYYGSPRYYSPPRYYRTYPQQQQQQQQQR
ncbi:MAG: hypothetical protein ACYTBP_00785 [Planctomycetota bacterium]|jgi:hypothetical protein